MHNVRVYVMEMSRLSWWFVHVLCVLLSLWKNRHLCRMCVMSCVLYCYALNANNDDCCEITIGLFVMYECIVTHHSAIETYRT